MKSKQAEAEKVTLENGDKIRRDRLAYKLQEVDEVSDGSKVVESFSGTLYGRDKKNPGTLLRMDKLGERPPVKGKAAKKAAKRVRRGGVA